MISKFDRGSGNAPKIVRSTVIMAIRLILIVMAKNSYDNGTATFNKTEVLQ